jgi:hypothetical protein
LSNFVNGYGYYLFKDDDAHANREGFMQPQYFRKRRRGTKRNRIGKVASEYRPLLGTWLIEIAILLDWHRPTKFGKWPDVFSMMISWH